MGVKLDRLLAIMMILVNRRRVQAKELADMFEVSVRTVYRDIEAINQAGIPVVTYQGQGGGIGVAEGFKIDRNFLTSDELVSMTVALRSLFTAYRDPRADAVLEKIRALVPQSEAERFRSRTESVVVDMAPWGHDPAVRERVELLKAAVEACQPVTFLYASTKGDLLQRVVEPYTLVLKGQKWYLYGLCRLRGAFRLFKLARMRAVQPVDGRFQRVPADLDSLPWEKEGGSERNPVTLLLRVEPGLRILAEEWFGVENVWPDGQGRFLARVTYPEDNWLYGFLLSFGPGAEVLEPPHLRARIGAMAAAVEALYRTP